MMSEPIARCIAIERSGDRSSVGPPLAIRSSAPSSAIAPACASENSW
jgi:hypothetical protein